MTGSTVSTQRGAARFKRRVPLPTHRILVGSQPLARRVRSLLPSSPARARCVAVLGLALSAAWPQAGAQAPVWNSRISLASDWVVRGQRLSDGSAPVLIAGADVYPARGWSLGAAAIGLRAPDGPWGGVWSVHAGHEHPVHGDWLLLVDFQHVHYERSGPLGGWTGAQLALGLAHGDRWALTWNAQQPRDDRLVTRSVDLGLRWPLAWRLGLTASLGRIVVGPGVRYGYGQAGVEAGVGRWQLRLGHHWVEPAARRSYGRTTTPRWVASAQWTM